MLTYEGVLLNVKRLAPSGTWTTPTFLVTLLDDDGEPLVLAATEDAHAVCEQAERLARVRVAVGLRTYKTQERGRVFSCARYGPKRSTARTGGGRGAGAARARRRARPQPSPRR